MPHPPSAGARRACACLDSGTSIAELTSGKSWGLNQNPTGTIGQSSERGTCVRPKVCQRTMSSIP